MSTERYPCEYEGDALRSLGVKAPFAHVVQRLRVVSETSVIVDLVDQTIAVDVQAPVQAGRAWTIRVEHTPLATGKASVVAEAHPIQAIRPSVPDGELIGIAIELAGLAKFREEQNNRTLRSVMALLEWIAPGARATPLFAKTVVDGHATVGYERTATGDVINPRIQVPGPWGPTASDLFR